MTVKCICPTIGFLLITLTAQADKKSHPKGSPADQLTAIQKAHQEAEAAFAKAAEALPDAPEGNKKYQELWKANDKGQGERFMAAVALAKAGPKSDVAFAALEWVLTI